METLKTNKVAILGYGNQGRAHALNLRDSGISVVVGARDGQGWDKAVADGFEPHTIEHAVKVCDILMFLFPDHIIPMVYQSISTLLVDKEIGFAHGYALHFKKIDVMPRCSYFLVGPKGAGAILRSRYVEGAGLPGVYALGPNATAHTREICLQYANAVGAAHGVLLETSFEEETVSDLFGEQSVLCGGLPQLMELAFNTLVEKGKKPQVAFFECCYEAKLILELWLKHGPEGMTERISPTAFFGGLHTGKKIVNEETAKQLQATYDDIESGKFSEIWQAEVDAGTPSLKAERERIGASLLNKTYKTLKSQMGEF